MQQPHVFPVCTPGIARHQGVVSPPVSHARIHVLAVHVARERPGLARQPVDHVPIVDAMLRLPTQPLHPLHQRSRVPYLDHFRTHARFYPLSTQPRRYRVNVLLHLNRAALAHPHPLAFQRFQTPRRQRTQPRLLLLKLVSPARIPPGHQRPHELPVVLAAGKISAAAQQQFLLQGLLETPMTLLAIAVLMAAVGVRRFGRHAVVVHQSLIFCRVLFGVAVVMHGQRHAVGAMTLRRRAQFPQGVLQALAQAGETLRETQRRVLPV
jgi:hypothetical protein